MLIYRALQSADIFAMNITIAHAGTDQRNVHIVARDASKEVGFPKPVAIHHHLLQGLLKPEVENSDDKEATKVALKMSKSKPDSAVFIHDSSDEIKRKVTNAYCPEGTIELNPVLDWVKHLVFVMDSQLVIQRKNEHGGEVTYSSYNDLEKDYIEKKLHPMDLKASVAEWLVKKLEPARKYFEDPKRKEALEEIERLTSK